MEYVKQITHTFSSDSNYQLCTHNSAKTCFEFDINFRIAWTMCNDTWHRLNLSKQDISIFFEETAAFAVWQSILLSAFVPLMLSNTLHTSIKPTNTLKSFTFISKRTLFFKHLVQDTVISTDRCLDLSDKHHVPFLPTYPVEPVFFQHCLSNVVLEFKFDEIVEANGIVSFLNKSYVATRSNRPNRLCLRRSITEEKYNLFPQSIGPSILAIPPKVRCGSQVYVVLPESVLIQTTK